MKLTYYAVLIGWVGLGLAAHGAQPADSGTSGNDSARSTGNAFQSAGHPPVTGIAHGVPGRRVGPVPVAQANATPMVDGQRFAGAGRDSRRPSDWRRSRGEPTVIVVINQSSSLADELAAAEYVNEETQTYYQPGYDWGAVIKNNTVDWADFIPYLQQYIVIASPVGKDAFRRGFIAGFGGSAEATYDYALRQACQRS